MWHASYPLRAAEHCLSVKEMPLLDDRGRIQPVVAMSTGFLTYRGEDVGATGRVRPYRWTVSRGSVVVVGQGSVLFLPVTLQLAVPRSRHVSCVCLDLVVLFVAVFSCGFVVVVCFGTWPWTWQLVFLLPQINADGQWIFWRVLDNDLRGAATALQYLKTPNGRYILLGVGSEVRRVFAPPLTL